MSPITVTLSAPSNGERGQAFTVSGYVFEGPNPRPGVTVTIYQGGTSKGTALTYGSGLYSKSITINQEGTFPLFANALDTWSNIEYITITEPEPEPEPEGWLYIENYRGYPIYLWQTPDEYYGYWFASEGVQQGPYATVQDCRAAIDVILEPIVISTTLTIDAPSGVESGETFFISGILYETDTSIPIPNHPINHSYNGRSLGSSTTGVDGIYLKECSIPEAGVWTLKSEFPGTEGLQASRAQVDSVVADTPIAIALQIAGSIATGLALFIYGTS